MDAVSWGATRGLWKPRWRKQLSAFCVCVCACVCVRAVGQADPRSEGWKSSLLDQEGEARACKWEAVRDWSDASCSSLWGEFGVRSWSNGGGMWAIRDFHTSCNAPAEKTCYKHTAPGLKEELHFSLGELRQFLNTGSQKPSLAC